MKWGTSQQPCWTCAKAYGGCSWLRVPDPKPVEGWTAEKRAYVTFSRYRKKDTSVNKYKKESYTYKIIHCPEYEKEPERVRTVNSNKSTARNVKAFIAIAKRVLRSMA